MTKPNKLQKEGRFLKGTEQSLLVLLVLKEIRSVHLEATTTVGVYFIFLKTQVTQINPRYDTEKKIK